MTILKFAATFLLVLCCCAINAQVDIDLKAYQAKYKSEQMVVLNTAEVLHIDIVKGQLEIYKTVTEEIVYLTEKASMFNQESIGFGFFSSVDNLEAQTYSPDAKGKLKTYKVKEFTESDEWTSGIFHDDSKSVNFVFPQLKEGAQTFMSFDRVVSNERYSDAIYFASPVPTENMSFKAICHPDVKMAWKEFNMEGIDFELKEYKQGSKNVYEWTAKDLKEVKSEDSAPAYSSYTPHIVVYPSSYTVNGTEVGLQRDVADLFSWYNELIAEHLESNGDISDELKTVVDSITANAVEELDRMKEIFYWTQDNIKYVAFEEGMGGFIPRPANLICTKKYGDCKDMAAIINAMANYAGIETSFVWIGSRDIPYKYSEVPTPMVDNHMIAAYRDNSGKVYFMDATGKEEYFGMPTSFIQGKQALLKTGENEHLVVEVPVVGSETNSWKEDITLRLDNGKVVGESQAQFNGYYKGYYNMYKEGLDKEQEKKFQTKYFSKGNNKCSVTVGDEFELHNREVPSKINYDLEIEDYSIEVDDELIINLNLEKFYSKDKIEKDREAPREFKFQSSQELNITLEIPDGYHVTSLPKNKTFDEGGMAVNMNYVQEEDKIIYTMFISVNTLLLEPAEFETWNEMIKTVKSAYRDSVVLQKTN